MEALSRLQTKNQELQRHLEKACRQLQHTVRDNKATVQRLKGDQPLAMLWGHRGPVKRWCEV